MSRETKDIRNVAIVGGGGGGKTTLVEAVLLEAGVIARAGRVEDGNTVSDHTEFEHDFGSSLESSIVHFDHSGVHVNMIDTPGRPDFIGHAIAALPAVGSALIVIDATVGIDPIARRLMKLTADRRLPRLIVVNKIDQAEDLPGLFAEIQATFGGICQPINLPAEGGSKVVDCYRANDGESDFGPVADFHTGIVDQVVEVDEALMARYLEQGTIAPEELHAPFEKALREAHLVPVCFVSAREGVGVAELLGVIEHLCPSPLEANPRPFEFGEAEDRQEYACTPDPGMPLVAHVFKLMSDPYVGKLVLFRVHQGTLRHGDSPLIGRSRKGVRVAHLFKVHGKDHHEVPELVAGDIGAVSKIDELGFDDVLHDGTIAEDLHLRPMPLPRPMYGLALTGTSKGAETKLGEALRKLTAEDPCLTVERVATTGEMVLRGLGEQHLRTKLQMLSKRYGIEVETHPPKVAYKETISELAEGHHRHKKQSGGSGQFGEVYLRVEPMTGAPEDADLVAENGLVFVDDTFGGSIPKAFLPAIEKGVKQVMQEGAIAGYPMQNIKVSVYDGKHHPVDSKEVAFIKAGRRAFIDAVQKARPVLLEPFVSMEITIPADMIGDISSDMAGRRGRIQGTDMLPGGQAVVAAVAPLSEVMTYANQLKSMTAGVGSYSMEYSHDEPTPSNVQAEVMAGFGGHDEDE
jgi:elongation factor G